MNKVYGYHRTSTKEQHEDRGVVEIETYCSNHNLKLEKVYIDKFTGKTFERPRYTVLKEDVLRSGDILIITEVDRLGRNKTGIIDELRYFKKNNIRVMILELPTTLTDYSSMPDDLGKLMIETINNMLLEMYASLSEAEMKKREKRQREGIEQKKLRGEWDDYGRPRAMDKEVFAKEYKKVIEGKQRPVDVIRKYNLTSPTFYRYAKEYKNERG